MTITVHSARDQLTHEDVWFGIGDDGYEKAMGWIGRRDGGRYEYFGGDEDIEFKWQLTADDLRRLHSSKCENGDDYCGSLFFGDFKIEFIWDDCIKYRTNCFVYGVDGYDTMEDGTPYNDCDQINASLMIPCRRTPERFARNIEEQIIDLLKKHPDLIQYAIKPTDPDKWYPRSNYKPTINMIH